MTSDKKVKAKKKDEGPADPAKKARFYFIGGLVLFVAGFVFCILNVALDLPQYQKVGPFNALFLVVGGALGMSAAERYIDFDRTPFKAMGGHLWKIITGLVMIAFGLTLRNILGQSFADSTSLLLSMALFGAYFLFLYNVRLKSDDAGRAKSVETAEVLVVAIFLAICIKAVGVQAFKIPSGSMLPTLQIGDHLLVSKFLYGVPLPYTDARLPAIRDPERGDVIVFAYPGDDNPDRPDFLPMGRPDVLKEQDFIKRIIGLPGETVEYRDNKVFINGERIEDPWGNYYDGKPVPDKPTKRLFQRTDNHWGPATIPDDMYLVLGDNRFNSRDSRFWGFVKKGRIKGKALMLYWSWPKVGRVGTIIK